ncbi:MAG: hypothetical protein MUC91_02240 [Verrucomicrobia bacterium]|jgi:hypothetical protein|nr:hypothetical protein [Verrucomicrobiota bacterium]
MNGTYCQGALPAIGTLPEIAVGNDASGIRKTPSVGFPSQKVWHTIFNPGSIYHAIGPQQVFIIALTLLLMGILLMGLLRREKRGIANIGFESFLIVISYLGAVTILAARG